MKMTSVCAIFLLSSPIFFVSLTACQKNGAGPVVAQVGRDRITLRDFQDRLQGAPPEYQQYVASPDGRREYLKLLVRERVLLAEAKRLGIAGQSAYKEAMTKFKADMARRQKEYETTLQIESTLRALRAKDLAVTDSEVETYYAGHRKEYDRPVEISAAHILVSGEGEARQAQNRLKAGEAFETVARDMSKDPGTAANGGKLRPFHRGMLVPEFEEAAASLKIGQVSGIVKTQFGFHIIKKLGEKSLKPASLSDVKEDIRAQLERSKFNQWVSSKEDSLGVKIHDQALAQLPGPGKE